MQWGDMWARQTDIRSGFDERLGRLEFTFSRLEFGFLRLPAPSHRSTHRGALDLRRARPGSAPMDYLRTHAGQDGKECAWSQA